MKSIVLQQFKKYIILFMIGVMCSILTYVIYVTDPLNLITEYHIQMAPHTLLFSLWKKPPINLYLSVYIFNITNPVEFLNGKEKLKVQEIGPYVYQEILENHNVTFNDNDTMTYMPKRTVIYIPEMSINDPKMDIIRVPNVPVLGMLSALHDAGFLINYPLIQLMNMLNTKPILNITVYDYLWGYEDSLVNLASKLVPNFINFQKFGLLDRLYDEGENIVTIYTQKNNATDGKEQYLNIDKYNGSPGLSQWGYVETESNKTQKGNTICNMIQGATEGIIFPSHLNKQMSFRVFRKAFCRPLPIKFEKEVITEDGLPGYLYKLTDDFADLPDQNPDNKCYCTTETCMKKGLSNITPCYYNVPAAASLPHFLNADPSLLEDVDGLQPDQEKHKCFIILEETFGVPIYVRSRMQTNLVMNHLRYNPKMAAFNGLTVPLFWSDLHTSMTTGLFITLKLVLQILPIMQTVLIYLFGIISITMIIFSLISTILILKRQEQEQEAIKIKVIDNPDIKIPLSNSQYTAIKILPTIKKITSKTDLFS